MKFIIGLALAFASMLSFAQSAEWKLSEVKDKNNNPVGYIYHTYSIGDEYGNGKVGNKIATGLRLICSTKGPANPIIAIYWDSPMLSESTQSTLWMADSIAIRVPDNWTQEGKIIFSPLSENIPLLTAMKTRKNISVTWVDKYGVQRMGFYNLNGFAAHLKEFNSACKL